MASHCDNYHRKFISNLLSAEILLHLSQLRPSFDCPNAPEATLKAMTNMDHYLTTTKHNQAWLCAYLLGYCILHRVPTDPGKREKVLNLKFCFRSWKSPEFWSWVVKINWFYEFCLTNKVLGHWNTNVSLLLIFPKFTNFPSFHRKFWTQQVPVSYQSMQRPELTDGHPSLFPTCAQSWNAAATKFDKHGNFEARQVF